VRLPGFDYICQRILHTLSSEIYLNFLRKQKIFKYMVIIYNMFGWFFRKKEVEKVKEDTKKSFDSVKNDIQNLTQWIKHLDIQRIKQEIFIPSKRIYRRQMKRLKE